MENSEVLLLSRLTLAQVDSPKLTLVARVQSILHFVKHMRFSMKITGRIKYTPLRVD